MFKKSFWSSALVGIVGATLLLTPEASEAQRRGGGRRGGDGGRNERSEWGREWNGGPRWGTWGYGYGLGYGNFGYYYPGYYDSGYYVTPGFTDTVPQGYQSNYFNDPRYQSAPVSDPNTAGFVVRLPDPNAEIWFENHKTQQRGTLRQYTSGSLDPNHDYTFHIRARWMDNDGRPIDQSRDVNARAGQQITVDFTAPPRERIPTTPNRGQFDPQ
jgi:uncharacterized protein (TIGR03000 family)